MADVNFNCPHCGQNLDAPETMVGMTILCPACKKEMAIPTQPTILAPSQASAKPPPKNEDENRERTVKMDLPPEFSIPEPDRRVITIKRAR